VQLLCEHLSQGAAEHGEVLGEHEHLATVDGAPAGDDPVGVGTLLDAAPVGPVPDQHVQLVEGTLVQEVVDALAGEHLPLVVLPLDRAFGPCVQRLLLTPVEVVEAIAHRVLGH